MSQNKMDKSTAPDDLPHRIINNGLDESLSRLNESESTHNMIEKFDLQFWDADIKRDHKTEPWGRSLNHAAIIDGLNSNSTAIRIKTLEKLLCSEIVDAKQQIWEELSQSLRKCFVSANNDIFLKALQIHHRLIFFHNTSVEGYLNLLKSTFLLLNSRYFNDPNKKRISQCLQLTLHTQSTVFKFLLHASRSVIDDVVTAFVSVVTFKSVFDLLGVLDCKSLWLGYICYGTYIRSTFFDFLKNKSPDFLKLVVANFVKRIDGSDGEICHYCLFLTHFWQYKNNQIELNAERTLETVITNLNQLRKIELADFLVELIEKNPHLLTSKLLNNLAEPLSNTNSIDNFVDTHSYIFIIITALAKSTNCGVLFGVYTNLRKGRSRQVNRNCTNLPQKIIDFTLLYFTSGDTTAKALPLLLNCCGSIYANQPASVIHVNPTKFLQSLQEFYRLHWEQNLDIRHALLSLFQFFYAFYGPSMRILRCDNEILVDLFSFTSTELISIANRLCSDKAGFEFVKSHSNEIIKPYLERVWADDINDDSELSKFIFFILGVSLGTRSAIALLDDDDDATVVENDKSVSLVDLIEKSLTAAGEPGEEFLGLLMMKVLVTNLDMLLYLQVNYQMQEKLRNVNSDVIDAQSVLRNNILVLLEYIGFTDDVEFEGEEIQNVPQIFEFFQTNEGNELRSLMEDDPTHGEFNWSIQTQRAFKKSLEDFDPSRLSILLQRSPKTYIYRKIELQWPPSDGVYYQLHPEDFSGVSQIISFGQKSGLLKITENSTYQEELILLLKQSRAFIRHQPEHFFGFDWFVGVIYLICLGDVDQSRTFGKEFDTPLQESFYQHFMVILEENCTCFQALKMLGVSPDILVQSWSRQCFFNYLTFAEVCNFLTFSLLYPVEYLLYYITAVFYHLNEAICTLTHSLDVEHIFKIINLSDFKLSQYMPLIEEMAKRYKNTHKL